MNIDQIIQKQEAHKAKTGKYFQVIVGRKKSSTEKEEVDMSDVDTTAEIHEHDGPLGKGFTIFERQGGKIKATGHGAHSETFDWRDEFPKEEKEKPPKIDIPPIDIGPIGGGNATSTPSRI